MKQQKEQMTKKELADRISLALYGTDTVINADDDRSGCFERLGYVDAGADHEPVMLCVTSNGVQLHWMFDETVGLEDMGCFLRGIVRAAVPSLRFNDEDERTVSFAYTDGGE